MVGASGAIAGVMGGYLVLFPRARVDVALILFVIYKIITVPAWLMLGLWFALQLGSGLAAQGAVGGGVAYWAHAGGFLAGLVLILPAFLKRGGTAFWRANHGVPPHAESRHRVRVRRDDGGPIRSMRREVDTISPTDIPRAGRRRADRNSPWGGSGR
jgi:hypothetical protein